MESEEADRRSRQTVAQVGLPPEHEAMYGARSGIALETALRNWAVSLGWSFPDDKQTLDKVVNWLAQHGHISADEAASLKTTTRVRNHCAHGRWGLLQKGQVDHLIQNAELWTQRLSAFSGQKKAVKSYSRNVSLTRSSRVPRLRPWVAWAFDKGQLSLRSYKSFSLGAVLFSVPVLIWGIGLVGSFESIQPIVEISARATGLTNIAAAIVPMLWIMLMIVLTAGIGFGMLKAGISRLNSADETSLAAASWIWVKDRSGQELLEVRRIDGQRMLSAVEYKGSCSTCGAGLRFEPASSRSQSAVTAKCIDYPANHLFTVDPSSMIAIRQEA